MKKLFFTAMLFLTLCFSFHQVNAQRSQRVSGYTTSRGTTVDDYRRTIADGDCSNNYSTKGNINPYTGKMGTVPCEGAVIAIETSAKGTGQNFLVPVIVRKDPIGTADRINYAGTAIISLLDKGALKGLSDDIIQPLVYTNIVLQIAESRFRWAIRFDPDNYLYHLNLGTILYRQGKKEESLASVRKAMQLNPKSVIAANYEEKIMREKVTVKILDDPQSN